MTDYLMKKQAELLFTGKCEITKEFYTQAKNFFKQQLIEFSYKESVDGNYIFTNLDF